jgi:hypothetical protein
MTPPAQAMGLRRVGRGFLAFSRAANVLASDVTRPPFFPIFDRYALSFLSMATRLAKPDGKTTLDLAKPVR